MKTEYEKKVFAFFTDEKNFASAAKIADQLEEVAIELVKTFWYDLAAKLSELKDSWADGWRIKMTEKYEQRYSGLEITHRDWMIGDTVLVAIRFEDLHFERHPYIGLWINQDLPGKVNHDSIYNDVRILSELKEYEQDSNKWWIKWKRLTYVEFDTYQKLECVIPLNRGETIDRCVNEVITLKDLVEEQVTTIINDVAQR